MKSTRTLVTLIAVLTLVLVVLVAVAVMVPGGSQPGETTAPPQVQNPSDDTGTLPTGDPTQPSTEIQHEKVSTATISAVGDILMHKGVFNAGYDSTTNTYDMSAIFKYLSDYVSGADMAFANLETTLCGLDNGYQYNGYPNFNCPDAIGTAMKNAGFDTILTANNHTYDTGSKGFHRTQEVLQSQGLAHLGTKQDVEAPDYMVAELNGINIGFLCYTYETANHYDDRVALNGITMSADDSLLITSFDYEDLPAFYTDLQENMDEMESLGAEAIVVFMHWGDEYRFKPNDNQKAIAQKMCNMGVDVIIGGHPHVVEPVELLTSEENKYDKTVCLYSMGNAVSNQRLGNLSSVSTAHTEDGVLFSVTFAKYSDGTVLVERADALPIWVDLRYNADWRREYVILPLDKQIEDWKNQFSLTDDTLKQAQDSYDRTWELVGEGIQEANYWYVNQQAALEASLGIQ